jgi:hypothetical protein
MSARIQEDGELRPLKGQHQSLLRRHVPERHTIHRGTVRFRSRHSNWLTPLPFMTNSMKLDGELVSLRDSWSGAEIQTDQNLLEKSWNLWAFLCHWAVWSVWSVKSP